MNRSLHLLKDQFQIVQKFSRTKYQIMSELEKISDYVFRNTNISTGVQYIILFLMSNIISS